MSIIQDKAKYANLPKIMGVVAIVIVMGNFLAMVFGKIPMLHFWVIMILCALIAFVVLPRLRKAIEGDETEKKQKKE